MEEKMKVDANKLTGVSPSNKPYSGWVKKAGIGVLCLALLATGTVWSSVTDRDTVSADEPYDKSQANPSFTIQHVGNVTVPDIQPGEGDIPLSGENHIGLNEDGTIKTKTMLQTLYKEYRTTWQETSSIEEASFLNGTGGKEAEGYRLSEIWFGDNDRSENQSDFLVLSVPESDGRADLANITLTNNPDHPELSSAEGGYYKENEDGKFVICIRDGDVIRLVFELQEGMMEKNADLFDYDVSDGGYYKEEDYYHKNEKHDTSGQADEDGILYVDAIENGIHSTDNYSGEGAKLAFGGNDIGTDLADEFLDDEMDTLNLWNYGQQDRGMTKGLARGIDSDGNLIWAENVDAPGLFGDKETIGRTDYTDREYSFVFTSDGFSRTLSYVSSENGDTEGLGTFTDMEGHVTNRFWIMDGAPSYGTDGHDPIWGDRSGQVYCYRSDDRAPLPFLSSDDGENHNSFFGFSYTEDFTLSPGYEGELGFFGYSDDDLWAFAAQVDENGQVIDGTAVPVIDMGGVHDGTGHYQDLWDVIEKIPYGEEAQDWKLFLFWLERDGKSSSCYLNFTLPEVALTDSHETASVTVEAGNHKSADGDVRTFVFDNGTCDRYNIKYNGGGNAVIVSGKPFIIPGGSVAVIEGIEAEKSFTLEETGRESVWISTGNGYEERNKVSGVTGKDKRFSFLSTTGSGTLDISAKGNNMTEDGYLIRISIPDAAGMELSIMDDHGSPKDNVSVDDDGDLLVRLEPNETVRLYGLPEGAGFSMKPEPVTGFHLSSVLLENGEADGALVTGSFPAYVGYVYEPNEVQDLWVTMEQSAGDVWSDEDIVIHKDDRIYYKITVTNPNEIPVELSVTDEIPEGIAVDESSLTEDCGLYGQILKWETIVGARETVEMTFTCQAETEGSEAVNHIRVRMDGKLIKEDMTVKAVME